MSAVMKNVGAAAKGWLFGPEKKTGRYSKRNMVLGALTLGIVLIGQLILALMDKKA